MLWIDHRPLTAIGLTPTALRGHLTAAGGTRARTGLAGRAGQVLGTRQAASEASIEVDATAKLTALPDRGAVLDAVELAYGGGVLRTLRTMDRPAVLTRVLLDGPPVITEVPGAPGLTIPRLTVTLRFLRVDGGSVGWPAPGPVLLGTTRTPIALGSLPSAGWILAWGTTSPLTITYTPASGVGATAWVITQAVATGEHLAADVETGDVWFVSTSGVRTRVSGVSGIRPALDPGDSLGSALPSLALSSGTGLYLPATRHRQ
jgi:hypothetical protein